MERYKVAVQPTARKDLESILRWLSERSRQLAARHGQLLAEGLRSLSTFPLRCPPVRNAEFAEKGYRYLVVKYYLVFFTVDGDTVTIRRILDGRSNYL